MLQNGFFWLALAGVIMVYVVNTVATLLNLGRLRAPLPDILREVYVKDGAERARAYAGAKMRLDLIESTLSLVVLLAFWLGGGFGWLDGRVRSLGWGEISTSLHFFVALSLGSAVLGLPGNLYATFVIEEKFGFNRTTLRTFILDGLKGLLLGAVLLLPLGAAILALIQKFGPGCWWVAWLVVLLFSLLISYVAPRWIMPLFNKFSPLPEGELRNALLDYAAKTGLHIADLSVIDGSRRSSKSNAFFTGFGRNKRIAFFDTLIAQHSTGELVAVLAHEVGHDRCRHVWKMLTVGALQTGVFFWFAAQMLTAGPVAALGFTQPGLHAALLLTVFFWKMPGLLLSAISQALSRRHEFEADRFACTTTGGNAALFSALRRLGQDNLTNPVPHPFYAWLHYSHPPMAVRLQALEQPPH